MYVCMYTTLIATFFIKKENHNKIEEITMS
jgi:hypothetical protein